MKNSIKSAFIKGSIVVFPVLLTGWFIWSLLLWFNRIGLKLLSFLQLESLSFGGAGLVLIFILVLSTGFLFQFNYVAWLYGKFEGYLFRFPLVKTLYSALKDFISMFDKKTNQHQSPVMVEIDGSRLVLGFITTTKIPTPLKTFTKDELVAVYMPMSYMIGGYTAFVPRKSVHPVNWSFEEAMRFALTAGVSHTSRNNSEKK
jgi:uncharacterized membrane protein